MFLPSPLPRSTEPVPDAPMDYTELWKAVSTAKESDVAKSSQAAPSNKGTEAYDNTLRLIGIDIQSIPGGKPEDVIDLEIYQLPQTVEYPNLRTDEQRQALANQCKRFTRGMNKATLAARIMKDLFDFHEVPEFESEDRRSVPYQMLEFRTPFTSYDRFNKDLYTFVRGSKKERASLPQESDLRSRSDLTFMAHMNAIGVFFRGDCGSFPGVHSQYDAIAPFLSIEFKVNNQPAKTKEAAHQIAVSSFVNLVERQRLPRKFPYIKDKDIRHYAYTICGNEIRVWCTTLQKEEKNRRSYTTYQVQPLRTLNLGIKLHLEEFLQWHQRIMTWGLSVYVPNFVEDLERVMGGPRRESLTVMILSAKKVTQAVNPDGTPEIDSERPDGGPDPMTEDLGTEYPASEGPATEYPANEAQAIEAPATESPGTEDPMAAGPASERAKGKATEYTQTLPQHQLNAAAMSLSKMTDRETAKAVLTRLVDDIAFLTRLVDDIGGFIKQLDEEGGGGDGGGGGGGNAGVKGKSKEDPPEEQASLQGSVIAPARSAAHRRGNTGKESSSLTQRPRWK